MLINLLFHHLEHLESLRERHAYQLNSRVGCESLTTNPEVTGSIPGSTVGIFLEGEDSRGDHRLGRLV